MKNKLFILGVALNLMTNIYGSTLSESITKEVPAVSKTKIIFKLDDLSVKNGVCNFLPTLDYLIEKKIKAGIGAIASKFDATAFKVLKPYLNAKNEKGESLFEVWHHGLDHAKTEFKDSTYVYQKEHFEKADKLIKELFGIQMHSFGTPYNQSDSTTNRVIVEHPNYKLFMLSKVIPQAPNGVFYMNNLVVMENGTGKPEFELFKQNYTKYKNQYKNYMILQGHPNAWTPEKIEQIKLIVDFLIAEGCEFETPYGYYQSLNKSTALNSTGLQSAGI